MVSSPEGSVYTLKSLFTSCFSDVLAAIVGFKSPFH